MKRTRIVSLLLAITLIFQLIPATAVFAENTGSDSIVLYPEYPEKIARDYMYRVYVSQNGNRYELPVYNYERHTNHYATYVKDGELERRFCEFSFAEGEVTIEVVCNVDMTSYSVIPSSKGIASTVSGNTVSFTIDKPQQLVFRLNDDDYTNLSIFADAVETDVPDKNASNVVVFNESNPAPNEIGTGSVNYPEGTILYFEKGWHDVQYLSPTSNQQVYIAPGAVLNSRIQIKKLNDNIKIFGRGLLRDFNDTRAYNSDGGASGERGSFFYLLTIGSSWNSTELTKNVNVKDIKLLDSKSFNIVFVGAQDCNIDNVKVISNEISTDGVSFWGNSRRITIENSYFYVCDNLIVIGADGPCGDITMNNIVAGTSIAMFFPQGQLMGTNNFTNFDIFRCNGAFYEPAAGYRQASDESGVVNITNFSLVDCVPIVNSGSQNAMGSLFTTRKTATDSSVIKQINMTNLSLPDTANAKKVNIGVDNSQSGNFEINLKNVYVGSKYLTTGSTFLNNGVKVEFTDTGATQSTLTATKDNTYTPVTRNTVNYSYTANELYIRDETVGVQVLAPSQPFEANGTVYVSAKHLGEKYGFKTYFDADDTSVTLYDEDLVLRIANDSNKLVYNDTVLTLAAPAIFNGEEMMVPFTLFEAIGVSGEYTASTKTLVMDNYQRVENLIPNGDFESKNALESWTTYNFTPMTLVTDSDNPANTVMRYTDAVSFTTETSVKSSYVNVTKILHQNGPGTYKMTFRAKCNDADITEDMLITGSLVTWYGSTGIKLNWQPLTASWQNYEISFVVSDSDDYNTYGMRRSDMYRYYASVTSKVATDVLIDDVTFVKVSDLESATSKYTSTYDSATNTITTAGAGSAELTYEVVNDYLTLSAPAVSGSNKTVVVTVAYPSNYDRTTRVIARDNTGKAVSDVNITIPAQSTQKHVVDFSSNMTDGGVYGVGDTVDTSGIKLKVLYNDNTTEVVTSGFDLDYDFASAGEKTITVTYDNKSSSVSATVNDYSIMPLGANIRVGSQYGNGIRFAAKLKKDSIYDTYYPTEDAQKEYVYKPDNNYMFGALMLPTEMLENGKTVVDMYNEGSLDVLDIVGKKVYSQNAEYITFTGVLINIPATVQTYTSKIQTAFYIKYRASAEDEWQYTFTDAIERSYYSVALAASEETYNYENIPNPTEDEAFIMQELARITDFVEESNWINGWY